MPTMCPLEMHSTALCSETCACISKYAGGIGLAMHNIRATDSYIRGSNGTSNVFFSHVAHRILTKF